MISTVEATTLTLTYIDMLDALAAAVGQAIRDVFSTMSGYDRAQLAEWLERVTPLTQAGAAEGANLAAAYLAELTDLAPTIIDDIEVVADLEGPYLRYWHDLKEGHSWEDSIDGGASQAEALGERATRDGAGQQFEHPPAGVKVIGWQRVAQPGACEWCQVVSTQLYHSRESGTFGHHECRCIPPIPVTEHNAKALRALNRSNLTQLRRSGAVARATEARQRSRTT